MTDESVKQQEPVQHENYLLKVLTMLVVIIGALVAFVWQDVRNNIFVLNSETNSINRRLDVLDVSNQSRAKGIDEQREELRIVGAQVNRIEKGLIRKRIISP